MVNMKLIKIEIASHSLHCQRANATWMFQALPILLA